jgi:GLTT repeat (6 copies)
MLSASRWVWPVASEIDSPRHGIVVVAAFSVAPVSAGAPVRRLARVPGLATLGLATLGPATLGLMTLGLMTGGLVTGPAIPGAATAGMAADPAGHRAGARVATSGMNRERLTARLRSGAASDGGGRRSVPGAGSARSGRA